MKVNEQDWTLRFILFCRDQGYVNPQDYLDAYASSSKPKVFFREWNDAMIEKYVNENNLIPLEAQNDIEFRRHCRALAISDTAKFEAWIEKEFEKNIKAKQGMENE